MATKTIAQLTDNVAPGLDNLIETVSDPSGTPVSRVTSLEKILGLISMPSAGRLTLVSGDPGSTVDVSAATTLYFTPYIGDTVKLYNTTNGSWEVHQFTELSIAIPSTTATVYDVFIYNNSGTLTLELVAWSSSGPGSSTRATEIIMQDGIYVKSGSADRLYLGTIQTCNTSGQVRDEANWHGLWNMYNRIKVIRNIGVVDTHTYGSTTIRPYNNVLDDTTVIRFVIGLKVQSMRGYIGGRGHSISYHNASLNAGNNNNFSSPVSIGTPNYGGTWRSICRGLSRYVNTVGYNYVCMSESAAGSGSFNLIVLALEIEK